VEENQTLETPFGVYDNAKGFCSGRFQQPLRYILHGEQTGTSGTQSTMGIGQLAKFFEVPDDTLLLVWLTDKVLDLLEEKPLA
jgi:hypothetical protein